MLSKPLGRAFPADRCAAPASPGHQAINLVYRVPGGSAAETPPYRDDQAQIELDARGRAWSFDADGNLLRL